VFVTALSNFLLVDAGAGSGVPFSSPSSLGFNQFCKASASSS
jgi:hypothetical protein